MGHACAARSLHKNALSLSTDELSPLPHPCIAAIQTGRVRCSCSLRDRGPRHELDSHSPPNGWQCRTSTQYPASRGYSSQSSTATCSLYQSRRTLPRAMASAMASETASVVVLAQTEQGRAQQTARSTRLCHQEATDCDCAILSSTIRAHALATRFGW